MFGEGGFGDGGAEFALEGLKGGARALAGSAVGASGAGGFGIAFGLATGFFGNGAFFGYGEFYSSAAGFGESDGDGLFGGTRAVFSLPNFFDFLADKLAGLGGGGFAFTPVFSGSFDGLFFGHDEVLRAAFGGWLWRQAKGWDWRAGGERF